MTRRVDPIVVVDWSASSRPTLGRDSIWVAVRDAAGLRTVNLPTRRAAEQHLRALLGTAPGDEVLLGVDFSLGYPAGTASALGLTGVPWRATWSLLSELVVDGPANRNNRFQVAAELNRRLTGGPAPFWGVPRAAATATLGPTKPADPGPVGEWRQVEQRLRELRFRPFSTWQLLGAGAVGSQSLVGIPVLERLRRGAARPLRVWPFDDAGREPGTAIVAEVWPTLFGHDRADGDADVEGGAPDPRDRRQVATTAERLWTLDGCGALDRLLRAAPTSSTVTSEEGWLLGGDDPAPLRGPVPPVRDERAAAAAAGGRGMGTAWPR